MANLKLELSKQHSEARQKQIYFLLAASGACIAFSLNQTREASLSIIHAPLGISILSWSISFLFGCLCIQTTQGVYDINIDLIKIQEGSHEILECRSQIPIAVEVYRKELNKRNNKSGFYFKYQFSLLVVGGIFYIAWHTIEMYLRSPS